MLNLLRAPLALLIIVTSSSVLLIIIVVTTKKIIYRPVYVTFAEFRKENTLEVYYYSFRNHIHQNSWLLQKNT